VSQTPFRILHVTDTHHYPDNDSVARLVDQVNAETHTAKPDLVIHTGDVINGYTRNPVTHREQLVDARQHLDRLTVPWKAVCHNHDTFGEAGRGAMFREVFGQPDFDQFTVGGYHLMLLSGAVDAADWYEPHPGEEAGDDPCYQPNLPAARAKLAEAIRGYPGHRSLLFFHLPLITPRQASPAHDPKALLRGRTAYGYGMGEECGDVGGARVLRETLAQAGCVATYGGHCHLNSVTHADGLWLVTTSSMIHYPNEARLITLHADRIEHEMVPFDGGPLADQYRFGRVTDADHPEVELYYRGRPEERSFVIRFTDGA